LSLATDER